MNKSALPKVSVCIPTYNYGHYLADAIKSVLAQTFTDFELLVIDDCSTDNTRETVRILMNSDSRIHYIQNEARLGFVGNFTRCIEVATGEYVKILCADDVLEATCLEKMVRAFDTHDHVTLVSCSRLLADQSLNTIKTLSYPAKTGLLSGTDVINRCFFSGNLIGEPTAVLFRKKNALRGFNAGYSLLVDLEMWFYLLEQGDIIIIPDCLCTIRRHEAQATLSCVKTLSFVNDIDKLYIEYNKMPYISNSFINRLRWRLGSTYTIWSQRNIINNVDAIRNNISKYMNYRLALIIMPFYIILKSIKNIVIYK